MNADISIGDVVRVWVTFDASRARGYEAEGVVTKIFSPRLNPDKIWYEVKFEYLMDHLGKWHPNGFLETQDVEKVKE